jgi:hypothetical protein
MDISPLEPTARRNLVRLAQAYANAAGSKKPRSMLTVSRYAHGDPHFFDDLIAREEQGGGRDDPADRRGSFTFRVYDKVLAWFKSNWPSDAVFPMLDDLQHSKRGRNGKTEKDGGRRGVRQEARPSAQGGKGSAGTGGAAGEALRKLRSRA